MIALTQVSALIPNTIDLPTLQSIARFILFMQSENGDFTSKYYAETGPDTQWRSLYYPGEAGLGLVMLTEVDNDDRWRNAAVGALLYLASTRRGREDVPADHWALLATARLLERHNEHLDVQTREALLVHAAQIASSISRGAIGEEDGEDSEDDPTPGKPLRPDGGTTPTATRLEGLLAIRPYLQGDLAAQIETDIHAGIQFLVDAQLREGPHAGAIPRISPRIKSDNPRATEVRIDYIQHALSAMLVYREQFFSK